ncbi:MAG: LysM peptidoglycan-binding domain-containing protein [Planctomycetota bacterium]|nr:LysM peptidoglycan-binding domain-containing protein [Planctomycetota bacterium]
MPSPRLRYYIIRPGDTLSRIAVRELGSISLATNIYLLNRDVIENPDQLIVGERIRLPDRETPAVSGTPTQSSPGGSPRPPASPAGRIHRVARGDTLSSMALRYYGSSASWRVIFEANQAVLPNPDRLAVGMELVIPPSPD